MMLGRSPSQGGTDGHPPPTYTSPPTAAPTTQPELELEPGDTMGMFSTASGLLNPPGSLHNGGIGPLAGGHNAPSVMQPSLRSRRVSWHL